MTFVAKLDLLVFISLLALLLGLALPQVKQALLLLRDLYVAQRNGAAKQGTNFSVLGVCRNWNCRYYHKHYH
jgi:hypothetical protein